MRVQGGMPWSRAIRQRCIAPRRCVAMSGFTLIHPWTSDAALASARLVWPDSDPSVPRVVQHNMTTLAQILNLALGGVNPPFDPYKDDLSFLLATYIFEDVGVTAYLVRDPS